MPYDPKAVRWPIGIKIRRALWSGVNGTLFRFSPFFCYGWRRFLLRCFGAKIDKSATISRTVRIVSPWNLTMERNSMIGHYAWAMCSGKVHIGENAIVGEYVKVVAGSHNTRSRGYDFVMSGVIIQRDAWVATSAILVAAGKRDLKIGAGSIVAAGAVVFNSVKPMTIVVGNPAEFLADRVIDEE